MLPTEASTGFQLSCEDDLDLILAQFFSNPVAPDLPPVAPDVIVVTGEEANNHARFANVSFSEAVCSVIPSSRVGETDSPQLGDL